ITGTAGGTKTATVTGSGTTYNVAGSGMTTAGTVIATVKQDAATAAGVGNTVSTSTDNTVTYDATAPSVSSINRATSTPTNLANVQFAVTFSEVVTGVDASDFSLATTGVSGASVNTVSGSGTTYTVTVNTGSGDGSVGLNLVDDDSIVDAAANPLGGSGAGNGNFTGEVYTIDKTRPTAAVSYSPTGPVKSGTSLTITATFDEPMADSPVVRIGVSGANTVAATNMTKVDSTHYTFTYTV